MSLEIPPSREKPGTLLETMESEKLTQLAERVLKLKVIDRLHQIVSERRALNNTLENDIAFERLSFLQELTLQNAFLEADLHAPDDEAIALEEAVNEALFKPFGNNS